MMKRIDDMARWTEAALDTPFKPVEPPTRTSYTPGICVKSREREKGGMWPEHYGRVVEFDRTKDFALVRSYGSRFDTGPSSDSKLAGTVWEGTISQCLAMWEID